MNQVQAAAMVAANSAVAKVMHLIPDLVQHEVQKVPAIAIAEKTMEAASNYRAPRYTPVYTQPPQKPASNYTDVLMKSIEWRKGRGTRLGIIWLEKPGTEETLQVEQFGNDCSVLRRDEAQPGAIWHGGKLIKAGMSCWTQFDPIEGQIETVVSKLLSRGWAIKKPTTKVIQLSLVYDIKPAAAAA